MIVWIVGAAWSAAATAMWIAVRRPRGDAEWWCRRCRHPVAGVGAGGVIEPDRRCAECGRALGGRRGATRRPVRRAIFGVGVACMLFGVGAIAWQPTPHWRIRHLPDWWLRSVEPVPVERGVQTAFVVEIGRRWRAGGMSPEMLRGLLDRLDVAWWRSEMALAHQLPAMAIDARVMRQDELRAFLENSGFAVQVSGWRVADDRIAVRVHALPSGRFGQSLGPGGTLAGGGAGPTAAVDVTSLRLGGVDVTPDSGGWGANVHPFGRSQVPPPPQARRPRFERVRLPITDMDIAVDPEFSGDRAESGRLAVEAAIELEYAGHRWPLIVTGEIAPPPEASRLPIGRLVRAPVARRVIFSDGPTPEPRVRVSIECAPSIRDVEIHADLAPLELSDGRRLPFIESRVRPADAAGATRIEIDYRDDSAGSDPRTRFRLDLPIRRIEHESAWNAEPARPFVIGPRDAPDGETRVWPPVRLWYTLSVDPAAFPMSGRLPGTEDRSAP